MPLGFQSFLCGSWSWSAIHALCDGDISYFYDSTVYNDYLQCFDYRKLGHSLRLNTAPTILSACKSLDSQIPSGVFWIWAISGVWKALSKNKYCFFSAQTSF